MKGVRGGLAGPSAAGGAEGWVGSQATAVHPTAVSWAHPQPQASDTFLGLGGTSGLWGAGDCRSYTLSSLPSLTHASENLTGTALALPGGCSLGCLWSPPSQGYALPLGWDHATSWGTSGVSPQTLSQSHLLVILLRNASSSVGGGEAARPVLPGLGPCLCKQRANACLGPFLPSLFWGPQGQVLLPCPVFSHHDVSRVCSEPQGWPVPKSRCGPARGWADAPIPGKRRPARCHPHRARAARKGSFLKGLSQEKGQKAQK